MKLKSILILAILLLSTFVFPSIPVKATPPITFMSDDFEAGTGGWTPVLNVSTTLFWSGTQSANVSCVGVPVTNDYTFIAQPILGSVLNYTFYIRRTGVGSQFDNTDLKVNVVLSNGTVLMGMRFKQDNVPNLLKTYSNFFGVDSASIESDISYVFWMRYRLIGNFTGTSSTLKVYRNYPEIDNIFSQIGLTRTDAQAVVTDTVDTVQFDRAFASPVLTGDIVIDDIALETLGTPDLLSLTITDLSPGLLFTNNIYSMYKYYTFVAVTQTTTNPNNVNNVTITCKDGVSLYFTVSGHDLDTVPVWTIISNSSIINLNSAQCSWVVVGTTGTATFKIETEWDFPSIASLDLYLEAVSPSGSSGIVLMQNNYFDVVSDLVATMESNVTDIFIGAQAEIHGGVFYEADPSNTTIFIVPAMIHPPDSEFAKVEVWNGTVVSALDTQITNGNYSVIFIPNFLLSQTQDYILFLYMKGDFLNGTEPQNLPTITLFLTSTWVPDLNLLTAPLQAVFDLFGVSGAVAAVWGMLTSVGGIGSWFIDSITMMVSYVASLATMFFNFGTWVFFWVGTMATFFGNIAGLVIGIFNGTASIGGIAAGTLTGIGNIWVTFGGTNLMIFLPFVFFIMWLQSLDSRQKTMGVGIISLVLNDFQTAYGLINVLTGFAIFIYSVVSDWVRYIYSYLSGFFTRAFLPF